MLTFVIISGGARPQAVARLLSSLVDQQCSEAEILIVGRHDGPMSGGSRLLAAPELADRAAICAMRNRGVDATSGDPVVLLDDDIEFTPGWLSAMRPPLTGHQYDLTGCRCITPTGRRWYDWNWASRIDPSCPPRLLDYDRTDPNAYISGCFMMIRRRVFSTVRFDEGRMNHQRDDVDFCHRAVDAGFTIGVVPGATVIHHLEPAGRSASDPASGSGDFAVGIALLRLERYDEAIERFHRAAATEGARAWYHEGVCLMAMGRFPEAAAMFETVAAQRAGDGAEGDRRRIHYGALYRLGLIRERDGATREANRLFAATLAGFPEHLGAGEAFRRTSRAIEAL